MNPPMTKLSSYFLLESRISLIICSCCAFSVTLLEPGKAGAALAIITELRLVQSSPREGLEEESLLDGAVSREANV